MINTSSLNLYLLIDIFLIIFISFAIYYSYSRKTYIKVFDYFKIFALISISAKFSTYTGNFLSKWHLVLADTYTILILIAFSINVIIIYYSWSFIYIFSSKFINNQKIKIFFAKLITVIEVLIITTFTLFILMQLSINKKYIYPTLNKSYSYPYIKSFYVKFLNDDFAKMILNSETGVNHKEVILKSFKNSF
ncbi:MAG: hypothetical protein U9P72_11340 [Campylobacterota bacterium]|nr:hypothetical protein [Campylobacterota bacterium]